MKMEKIDDNKIRCILTSDDLAARQLSIEDLAYGSEKARRLFQEMMKKATMEMNFHADGTPLMIEAIPLMSNGIMLIISRVEDPEELDTRFSRFTQPRDSGYPDEDSSKQDFASMLFDTLKRYVASQALEGGDEIRCFRFDTLAELIRACRNISHVFMGDSSLYKGKDGLYYLILFRDGEKDAFEDVSALLAEYGSRVLSSNATPSYFEEHYERLISDNVIETLGSR